MSETIFFRDKSELKKWFGKYHSNSDFQWVGLHKKATQRQLLTMAEVVELAICFGWSSVIMKRIDLWSYQIKLVRRKAGSAWSAKTEKKYLELKKKKLIRPSGEKAYQERNQKKSENSIAPLSASQIKLFRKNKTAWKFFESQTPSYRKYMVHWVNQAKRTETREKRLQELIYDSGQNSKLKRVLVAQEKVRPRYEEGKTPIEEAMNIGLTTGAELREVEISTVEQLKRMGWEKALSRVCRTFPHRLNLNYFYALVGAVEDQNWRSIEPHLKAEAKDLLAQLRS